MSGSQNITHNMNLIEEIRALEAKGVYIHLNHEHYTTGSNCNWAIEILDENRRRKYHTGWYGDNHEFGDTIGCYEAAFRLAKFLLTDDNAEWFFFNVKETVTQQGYDNWIKHREVRTLAHQCLFN